MLHLRSGGRAAGHGLFLAHGGDDGNSESLAGIEFFFDLIAERALGEFNVILGGAIRVHEVEVTIVDVDLRMAMWRGSAEVKISRYDMTDKLVFRALHVWNVHVVG